MTNPYPRSLIWDLYQAIEQTSAGCVTEVSFESENFFYVPDISVSTAGPQLVDDAAVGGAR
jgi:hypothetical protein